MCTKLSPSACFPVKILDCTEFLSSAPFEFNLAFFPRQHVCQARWPKHLCDLWACFNITFCECRLSCCLIFGSHWHSLPSVSARKMRTYHVAPIIMVPNHKFLITLATLIFHCPHQIFQPVKMKTTAPKKDKTTQGPKT